MKQNKKIISTLLFLGAAAFLPLAALPVRAESGLGAQQDSAVKVTKYGWCVSFDLPVAKAEGQPRDWRAYTTYCQPFKWAKGQRQVDVLTHGATYTQSYWDWPQDPGLYSYEDKVLADGRAVLNYDRIGNGQSTRPLSNEITMDSDAYVLHQLITGLKFVGYKQINSVGHSYGSGVVVSESANYDDVSRVILTGYLHRPSNPAVTTGNYPANQDPKFAGLGLDGGYLTSRPGVRGTSFHSPTSDPAVVAYDEQQKDLVSLTGLLDFIGERNTPAATNLSNQITVPVLSVTGQLDAIFCYDPSVFNCADQTVVKNNELPYFAASPSYESVTIPTSGHDLTLHQTANDSYGKISQWIKNN